MRAFPFFALLLASFSAFAQNQSAYSRQDSLRGALRPERTCYDVNHYDLGIHFLWEKKAIQGACRMTFTAQEDFTRLQIDLFERYDISDVSIYRLDQNEQAILTEPLIALKEIEREGAAIFLTFDQPLRKGERATLAVNYEGAPQVAKRPPWDGGFTWAKDRKDRDWLGVSCQGLGASSWWPCKDHLSDEPDSMTIRMSGVPFGMMAVANGNLVERGQDEFAQNFTWKVSYPINTYCVSLNVAHYAHFTDSYQSEEKNAPLALDYYVLDYNLDTAKAHFQQVKPMLEAFERYFGPYPFWEDGFALVETPYWGMEHQSAVAYGNDYKNNNYNFDFIIVHESGHEYFGNSVSVGDAAEWWIHEGFTSYMEPLYLEAVANKKLATRYLQGRRMYIQNQRPVVGPLNVNYHNTADSDEYYKGAWMLHTLRHVVGDEVWFPMLKAFYGRHRLSVITTDEVIDFFEQYSKMTLRPVMEQYLYYPQPPMLEAQVKVKKNKYKVKCRWIADAKDFSMPLEAYCGQEDTAERVRVNVSAGQWTSFTLPRKEGYELAFDRDKFYFKMKE